LRVCNLSHSPQFFKTGGDYVGVVFFVVHDENCKR
jgi:hypothetical protein